MLAYLLAGAVAIGIGGDEGLPAGPLLLVCRTSFFLACLGVGRCCSAVMEKRDKFAKYALFCHPTPGLNLSHCCLGRSVCLRSSWCRFPMGVVGTYGVTVVGIAFLMRCCKILSPVLGRTRLAFALSDNAFSVTRHHALGFFLATALFAIFAHVEPGVIDFDHPGYLSSYSYRWMLLAVPQLSFVYARGAILVSLGIHWGWRDAKRRWKERRISRA